MENSSADERARSVLPGAGRAVVLYARRGDARGGARAYVVELHHVPLPAAGSTGESIGSFGGLGGRAPGVRGLFFFHFSGIVFRNRPKTAGLSERLAFPQVKESSSAGRGPTQTERGSNHFATWGMPLGIQKLIQY